MKIPKLAMKPNAAPCLRSRRRCSLAAQDDVSSWQCHLAVPQVAAASRAMAAKPVPKLHMEAACYGGLHQSPAEGQAK